jgi:hypothetical protein
MGGFARLILGIALRRAGRLILLPRRGVGPRRRRAVATRVFLRIFLGVFLWLVLRVGLFAGHLDGLHTGVADAAIYPVGVRLTGAATFADNMVDLVLVRSGAFRGVQGR